MLSCLSELTRRGIGSFVVAHVIPVGYVRGAEYGHEDQCRRWLEKRAEPLRKAGFEFVISVSASGVPAEELLAVANAHGADLILVGCRSHNFLHDLFLGSIANEVIRKSEIPVLIEWIEPTEADTAESCAAVCSQKLDRILLATDLSPQSELAEKAAIELAARAAQTDCLMVLPDVSPSGIDLGQGAETEKLDNLLKRIESNGGRGRVRIENGDPPGVIARVAQEAIPSSSASMAGTGSREWSSAARPPRSARSRNAPC